VSFVHVLEEAARGILPAPDDQVEVLDEDPGRAFGVLAFPAHFYVLAPVEPQWVHEFLRPGDYGAPLGATFLTALAGRLGAGIGTVDAVLAACAHGGGGDSLGLRPLGAAAHRRVERAYRYRDDVRAWQTGDGAGCLVLGRGRVGRWEVALEVEPHARGRGLGRALAAAALGLLPAGTPVFAQVAPGNSISLRATLAAGYGPVAAEVLLPRDEAGDVS
jgi:GNAT superfamily N-acetyltransferase